MGELGKQATAGVFVLWYDIMALIPKQGNLRKLKLCM